jgi:hypothetical protein
MLSQIPIARYQEPLFWANGHCQSQAWELQATWQFQRLLHRLGTSNRWECLWRPYGSHSDALVAGLFGFPQIANCFATVRRRRSRREPVCMLSEGRIAVNRSMKILKVIGPCNCACPKLSIAASRKIFCRNCREVETLATFATLEY